VASLAVHLLAFAAFPRVKPPVPAARAEKPFEIVELRRFTAPVPPPPPPPRPRFLTIDEHVDEAQELPDAAFDPGAPAPPEPSPGAGGSFVVFQEQPRLLRAVRPEYPSTARSAGMEGTVRLLVTIDEAGRVVGAEVLHADARVFERPALEAVRQWRFRPALQSGQPVPARVVVPVRFSLR